MVLAIQPALAQWGQGLTSGLYQNGAKSAVSILKAFYKEHQQLPRTTTELDDILVECYTAISGSLPDLITTPITNWNDYRVLGSVMIKLDPTCANAPVDAWRLSPPQNWMVPGGKIVILSDGSSQYLIWFATIGGTPMLDENNHCIFMVGNFAPPTDN